MKTAIVIISTLIGYTIAQNGGAKLSLAGFKGKGELKDGQGNLAVKSDPFSGSISGNERMTGDARVKTEMGSGSIQMEGMDKLDAKFGKVDGILEPELPDFDDENTTNDNIAIDEKVLEQFNLTKADLMNSTELQEYIKNNTPNESNPNWCAEYYPDNYINDTCKEVYDDYISQVQQFKELVQNISKMYNVSTNSSVDYKAMRKENITTDKNININIRDDFKFKVSMSDDMKFTQMRIKFLNYFDWALIQGQDKYTNMMDSCPNECNIDNKVDMCCTTVKMYQKGKGGSPMTQLQCMSRAAVEMSTGIWLDDFYYEYQCKKEGWNNTRSSAIGLAVGAASLLSVITMM